VHRESATAGLLLSVGHGEHDVVAFAFAEEEVAVEEEVGGGHGVQGVGGAAVVEVGAAGFDVFARLAFGGGEAAEDEQFDEGFAGAFELAAVEGPGGDFADDFVEDGGGDAGEVAAEEDLAGADGFGGGVGAVDEFGDGAGEGLVGGAGAGVGGVLLLQGGDFVAAQEGEVFEVADDVAVVGADPELVEAIDAGAGGVEPDGAGDGFAELGAVGVGDEGQGEAEDGAGEFFAGEVNAGGDVAPLVAAADLEAACS